MIAPYPVPEHETARLKSLRKYDILDGIASEEYNRITRIASQICNTPVSLMTLLDEKKQWIKASYGFQIQQTPREVSFCNYTIMDPSSVLEVPDMRKDDRFSSNPLVASDPHAVFYAGAPLITPKGFALGSICVLDRKENRLDDSQRVALVALSQQVMNSLELKLNIQSLRQTQRRLKTANKQLKGYAHVVSHDLKTPVANIKLLTRMLDDEIGESDVNSGQKDVVALINESACSMLHFIDGLLKRSGTLYRGKAFKVVNVHQLLQKTIRMIAPPSDVQIQLDKQLPKIKTDPILLQQVFQNLVTNAIKYNDKAEPLIRVSSHSNHSYHAFIVEDNGNGIPAEQLDHIFHNRATLDTVDRYGNKGTGLGLYAIKSGLHEIGGRIEVTSQIGTGSRFTFYLPAI